MHGTSKIMDTFETYQPSAPMKNYSLLIMGVSNGDEDGGGVVGDGSGGSSPSRQGAETETFVPRIRFFGGGGAIEHFWRNRRFFCEF